MKCLEVSALSGWGEFNNPRAGFTFGIGDLEGG